jgi:hypothetical protein
MLVKMKEIWQVDRRFDVIILDYFFSPPGWADTRWSKSFFDVTLPGFVQEKILKDTGAVWLPNISYVLRMLNTNKVIDSYYVWNVVRNPLENPLYQATNFVTNELEQCPDVLTNQTQMKHLKTNCDGPFICMRPRIDT